MPDGTKSIETNGGPEERDGLHADDLTPAPCVAPPTPENQLALEQAVPAKFSEPEDAERFRLAIGGSGDGNCDWDVAGNKFYMSQRHKEIFGYEDHEISDDVDDWLALIHPDDLTLHKSSMAAHLRGERNYYDTELRIRRKDGSSSKAYVRGRGCAIKVVASIVSPGRHPIFRNARPWNLRGPMRNRGPDAHRTAWRTQSMCRRTVLHYSIPKTGWKNPNTKFAAAFGDIPGGIHEGLLYPELIAILAETIVLDGEGETSSTWFDHQLTYHNRPEGSVVIQNNDNGTVLMLSDVTAIKRAEQDMQNRLLDLQAAQLVSDRQSEQLPTLAEQFAAAKEEADAASRTKSEFLANMSHELRMPLNAVMGFSEVIKNELFGPVGVAQYKQYADDIYESGAHLMAIINDILDLSKVEAGKFDLNETEIQVPELCRSVIHIVKGRADEARIMLIKRIPEDLPYLLADPRSLKQMLLNLMSNAIKFTSSCATVDLVASIMEGGGFRFDIRDTGVGIAPEHFDTVLSLFGQVDTAHARDHQGTGLGLPLVKAFIEMHGGYIEIESELDAGTTVSLFFPPGRTRNA